MRAAKEEKELADSADESLFELAAADDRIMVTFDVKDFSSLLIDWAEAGRSHAGCIVFVSLLNNEYGAILRRLQHEFAKRPSQQDWKDLALYF